MKPMGGSARRQPTEAELREWLVNDLATVMEISPSDLDVDQPLEQYGLDSLQASWVTGDLEEWLGVELPATLVWDYPTVALLAKRLAIWSPVTGGPDPEDDSR